jgi:hypothetical protein
MRASSSRATSRKLWLTSAVGTFAALALAGTAWSGSELRNDETYNQFIAVPLPAGSAPLVSFDISWVDSVLRTYYLADRNNKSVDAVSTLTYGVSLLQPGGAGFVGARSTLADGITICTTATPPAVCAGNNNVSGPDGVLTVDNKELWVGDGNSRIWVMNPTTGAALTLPGGAPNPIPTSTGNPNRADELCYDPVDHLVMAANNADNPPFASLISTTTYTVVGKIVYDGTKGAPKSTNGAEQCAWSPRTGMFTETIPGVNNPDDGTGVVAVIDPKTMTVVKTFPIPLDDCSTPQGQAVGPAPQILLGCNGKSPDGVFKTVIINENSGAVIQTLLNEGGNDEVWYNPGDGHYFLGRGQFLPDEYLGVVDSQGRAQDQSIQTGNAGGTTRRTHSVAADASTNFVYMPIPAVGGGTAPLLGFQSTLCGGTAALQGAGCIAIFAPTLPDDSAPKVVERKKKGDHDWDDHHAWNDHDD